MMRRSLTTIALGIAALLLFPLAALAQDTGTVTGMVTDSESGEPLPGASILIVELQQGGATGSDGTYTIEDVTPGQYTIRASFIGYQEMQEDIEIDVEAGETVTQNFSLVPSYTDLEEVVVVGYGERSRRDVTGSVSSVSSEEIENVPTSSPEELLQGRTAGVQINKASGLPGSAIEVDIRGNSSINSGTQPLFVIDGVPARSRSSASGFGQAQNALQFLNPSDIQSIEVLKDASASAIYGSRAANGVVLITTKEGRAGGTDISANYYAGASSPTDQYDVLSSSQFVTLLQDGSANTLAAFGIPSGDVPFNTLASVFGFNFPPLPTAEEAPENGQVDQAFRTGFQQQVDLSARGGNESTRFYASGTYFGTDGFVLGNQFRRISGRLNLNHDINDWSRLSGKVGVTRVYNDRASADNNVSGIITSAILRPPFLPIRDENGEFDFGNPYNIGENVIGSAEVNDSDDYEWRVNGNLAAEVDPFQNLTLRATGGLDFFTTDQYFFNDPRTVDGRPSGAREQDYFEERRYLVEGTADYTNTFGEKHFLNLLGGTSYERVQRNQVFAAGTNVATNQLRNVNATAQKTTTFSDVDRQQRLISYFARANYEYNDRYILELTGRVDGSTRFSESNRFGFFPSGAVAWRLSEESFMEPVEFVNELKLRASYGITGNDQIFSAVVNAFPALALFGSGAGGNYGGVGGLAPVQLPSPDLKWEQTGEFDVGLDLGLFDQRVFLTADFYNKNTSDLIQAVTLPASAGINSFVRNVGGVRNRGFEFSIETQNFTGDFTWSTNFNAATNDNEVTELVDQDGDGVGDPLPGEPYGVNRIEVGRPIGAYYLIPYEGVDPETGDPIYTDSNGDGFISPADRQFVGESNPDWTGGITNRLGYKGLELSFFFQFEAGGGFYNSSKDFASSVSTFNTYSQIFEDRWQERGDETSVPRVTLFDINNASRTSTRFLTDGSYLRLKDVTLGYSLPQSLLQSLGGVTRARIYVKGQNLLTFTDVDFADPEGSTIGGGPVFFSPPQLRSIQGGVNLTF